MRDTTRRAAPRHPPGGAVRIPYTTEVRPDTGLTNPKLGIWLFLASEVMLFGSLFSAYALLRSGASAWPDQSAVVSVPLATLNTIVLISSSVTMVLAWATLAPRTGALGNASRSAATTVSAVHGPDAAARRAVPR